nr:Protein ZYX-1, isoform e [Haemonchus contortus]
MERWVRNERRPSDQSVRAACCCCRRLWCFDPTLGYVTDMSYLSPLPHYPTPRLTRARSYVHVPAPFPFDDEVWDPRHRLLHPLHSFPQRHYHLAAGRQRRHSDVTTIPYLRRPTKPVPLWTVRHYSTQPLACARPATTNRFEVTSRIYPMDEWTDRINDCLTEIGRTARSSISWNAIRPENRFISNSSVKPQSTVEPMLPSSFDAVPKNLYQTFNNPSSKAFIENKLEPQPPPTSYRPIPRSHSVEYPQHHENNNYNYQTYIKETSYREEQQQKTRPSKVQWETPYVRSSSPILDPHARIREYATSTYVEPEPPRGQEYVHTVRRETHTTRSVPNDFATTLRNQGLTASQREANQHQASTLRRDHLPFNADYIYKEGVAIEKH